jgi:hypothetical protein
MKKLTILLLLAASALAQNTPTNLQVKEETKTVNLGSILSWSTVPGATYSVYRTPNYDCGGKLRWEEIAHEIAHSLTLPSCPDNPLPLGPEWYTVTAVVGGTESAKSVPVSDYIGNKFYFTAAYDDKTGMAGAEFTLTQTLDGVSTVILSKTLVVGGNAEGSIQLFQNASSSASLKLPGGRLIEFAAPFFNTNVYLPGVESSYKKVVLHHADGTFVHYVEQAALQPMD